MGWIGSISLRNAMVSEACPDRGTGTGTAGGSAQRGERGTQCARRHGDGGEDRGRPCPALAGRGRPGRTADGGGAAAAAGGTAHRSGDLDRRERRPACDGVAVRQRPFHRHPVRRAGAETADPHGGTEPGRRLDLRHAAARRRAGHRRRPCAARTGVPPHRAAGRARRDQPADALAAGPQRAAPGADQHPAGPAGAAGLFRGTRRTRLGCPDRLGGRAPADRAALRRTAVADRTPHGPR